MSNPLMSSWAGLRAELDRLRAQAYDPRARALEEHERAVRAAVTKVGRAVEAIEVCLPGPGGLASLFFFPAVVVLEFKSNPCPPSPQGDLTCSLCMRPMEEPRTLMPPCPHLLQALPRESSGPCHRWLRLHRMRPGKLPTGIYPNKALDAVLGKWIFQSSPCRSSKKPQAMPGP
ncbi:hypothetical protein PAPYR_12503 [Paratrimastix pyriformis]|uniref:RING-type domain-containing protein n=1 Tax=Paratrimastix pyriformis TaxID=342808 RepID=A0ABQ8U6A0_9EUKA|nr:hypothetical protein PAPYR_12503 [Paratrimastix pyriformis]